MSRGEAHSAAPTPARGAQLEHGQPRAPALAWIQDPETRARAERLTASERRLDPEIAAYWRTFCAQRAYRAAATRLTRYTPGERSEQSRPGGVRAQQVLAERYSPAERHEMARIRGERGYAALVQRYGQDMALAILDRARAERAATLREHPERHSLPERTTHALLTQLGFDAPGHASLPTRPERIFLREEPLGGERRADGSLRGGHYADIVITARTLQARGVAVGAESRGLVIEVDGGMHGAKTAAADARRDALIAATGYELLIVSEAMLQSRRARAATLELLAAHLGHGDDHA